MAILVIVSLGVAACSNPTRHGGTGGSGGTGGGGAGGSGGGNLPPATHDVVDPSLPPGVVGGFDGAGMGMGGVTLVYPNAGAMVPHDLAPIDVQWSGTTPVYRVTFAVDNGNRLRGYVPTKDWIPPAGEWPWLLDVAAGHQITLSVDGATVDANGTPQGPLSSSAGQPLGVSHDDATGALFYFATTGDQVSGDGTLERLELGAQTADKYLNKTNDGGKCVGCHALTRDGTRVAFTFLDLTGVATGTTMSLGSVDATNPAAQQATANTQAATSSFSPDGTKIVTAYNGKLSIRDAVTGVDDHADHHDGHGDVPRLVARRQQHRLRAHLGALQREHAQLRAGQHLRLRRLARDHDQQRRHLGQRDRRAAGGERREQLLPVVLARRAVHRVHARAVVDQVELVGRQHRLQRPGRQRPVVRQPVGDGVDHAGSRRRARRARARPTARP